MIKYLLSSFGVVLIFSCTPTSSLDQYSLKGTEEILSFPVIEEARMPQNEGVSKLESNLSSPPPGRRGAQRAGW